MRKRGMYSCLGVLKIITEISPEQEVCPGQVIVSETFIGADNNVKLAEVYCPENVAARSLSARQAVDVCGDTCRFFVPLFGVQFSDCPVGNTSCFTPSGGGPNPNDCTVIADAMLFYSQNVSECLHSPSFQRRSVDEYFDKTTHSLLALA